MRPLVAHCHLGLGKLYRRTGDGAKAEEHLTTARAMYREMDMGFYLAQADTELGAGGEAMTRVSMVALLALALLAAPLAAEAQPAGKVPRIGFLALLSASSGPPPRCSPRRRPPVFQDGLRRLGYQEGQNLVVERRYADGNADRLPGLAAELVELRVELIVTETTAATRAAEEGDDEIPIVCPSRWRPG